MTVSSTDRRAGPFYGNGSTTEFPFTFKVFATTDVEVTYTDADGVEAVLDSNYSVTLNADQDNDPGGTITYPLSGSPMASPESLVATGALDYTQPTDITNVGRFQPQIMEDALDRTVMLVQQLRERLDRQLLIPASGPFPVATLPAVANRADRLLVFDEDGQPAASSFTETELASAIAAAYSGADGPLDALSFVQAGTGAVSRTAQSKARESVSVFDFMTSAQIADVQAGTASLDVSAAIQAAIDYLYGVGGGWLWFPEGVYRVDTAIHLRQYVTLMGVGSRSSIIKWGAGSFSAKGVVYVAEGTDMSPDFVFSTGIWCLGIDCNDVAATVGLAVRGVQENCVFHDITVEGFVSKGIDVMAYSSVNHKARFEVLHLIPKTTATTAVGFYGLDMQGCEIRQIACTVVPNGSAYFAKGIYLGSGCGWNIVDTVHVENCIYGIHETSGAINTYRSVEGLCSAITGTAHFWSENNRHAVYGMRSVSGYTSHYVGPVGGTIAGGSAIDSQEIVSGGTYFRRVSDTLTEEYTGDSVKRGTEARAGSSGWGLKWFNITDAVNVGATRYLVVDLGASGKSFSGLLKIRGNGNVRMSIDVHFGGYADTDGTVDNPGVSASGYLTSALTIGNPAALAVPEAGKFRIPITEAAGYVQAYELELEITRQDGRASSVSVSS